MDVGADRNVGVAVWGAAAVEVDVAITPVAAGVGVKVNVGVMSAKGVAVAASAVEDGEDLGMAVSARGMINGGSVTLLTTVGVSVTQRGVGVREES